MMPCLTFEIITEPCDIHCIILLIKKLPSSEILLSYFGWFIILPERRPLLDIDHPQVLPDKPVLSHPLPTRSRDLNQFVASSVVAFISFYVLSIMIIKITETVKVLFSFSLKLYSILRSGVCGQHAYKDKADVGQYNVLEP